MQLNMRSKCIFTGDVPFWEKVIDVIDISISPTLLPLNICTRDGLRRVLKRSSLTRFWSTRCTWRRRFGSEEKY